MLVASLAAAFRDNPLNRAVLERRPAQRLASNRAGMHALLPLARRFGHLWQCGDGAAGVIVAPPDAYPFPPPSLPVELRTLWVQGFRARSRWASVFDHLRMRHPTDSHWYVATLGVRPDAQRQGLGRALLARVADAADHAGEPIYLETDREENVGFYERAGFKICAKSRVFDVPLWHMRRAPRAQ